MYHFLLLQYKLRKITKTKLKNYVPKYITEEEYEQITGIPYSDVRYGLR